jgi:hypothetical protein
VWRDTGNGFTMALSEYALHHNKCERKRNCRDTHTLARTASSCRHHPRWLVWLEGSVVCTSWYSKWRCHKNYETHVKKGYKKLARVAVKSIIHVHYHHRVPHFPFRCLSHDKFLEIIPAFDTNVIQTATLRARAYAACVCVSMDFAHAPESKPPSHRQSRVLDQGLQKCRRANMDTVPPRTWKEELDHCGTRPA